MRSVPSVRSWCRSERNWRRSDPERSAASDEQGGKHIERSLYLNSFRCAYVPNYRLRQKCEAKETALTLLRGCSL